ncbi:MAG: hypothetical protein AB1816_21280, partial [Bacillota bacterium]
MSSDGRAWSCSCGASGVFGQGEDGAGPDPYCRDVLEAAGCWFSERLWGPDGAWVRAYLASRGVSREAARRFGLGWSPRGLELVRRLLARGRSVDDLVSAGLLERDRGMYRPRFRDRLMFPVRDGGGAVLGFAG